MDFMGIMLTFLSTALITVSRLISDQQRNFRNYLVYVGLMVSGAAVFVTYNNVQAGKERLRKSNEENERFKEELKGLKFKMFALNGQIQEATSSLMKNNDVASMEIAEKLRSSTGELLSANYSTSSVVNDLLKEQNDSLKRVIVKAVNIMKQSVSQSEANMKAQLRESENNLKQIVNNSESTIKIGINNLEEHVDDKFEETAKKLKIMSEEMEDDSSSAE